MCSALKDETGGPYDDRDVELLLYRLALQALGFDELDVQYELDDFEGLLLMTSLVGLTRPSVGILEHHLTAAPDVRATLGEFLGWISDLPELALDDVSTSGTHSDLAVLADLEPGDYRAFYALAIDPRSSLRWSFTSGIPGVEQLVSAVETEYVFHATIKSKHLGRFCGHIGLTGYDAQNEHAYLTFLRPPGPRGWLSQVGLIGCIERAFRTYPLRKLYILQPAFQSLSARLPFASEIVISEQHYYAGRYWDRALLSVTRDTWHTWISDRGGV